MKRIATGIVVLLVVLAAGCSQVQEWPGRVCGKSGRRLELRHEDGWQTVPQGKAWMVDALQPALGPGEIGTADLYVKGQVFSGRNSEIGTSGEFDVCVRRHQTEPFFILEGSVVEVGESRRRMVVTEVDCPLPEGN